MSLDAPNKGVEILQELHKAPILPPYRLQAVQNLKRRLVETIRQAGDFVSLAEDRSHPSHQNYATRIFLHSTLAVRWKRYLACYFFERWRRIRNLHWYVGRRIPEPVKANFAQQEKEALDDYHKLIQQYTQHSGIEVTTSLTPPVVVNVEIDVLENLGSIQTESGGMTTLHRGSRHMVKRRDFEHLIRGGFVREVRHHVQD